jgi:hypothetical protein
MSKPLVLRCKKCLRQWEYKGKSPYYATCPRCYNKVRIVPLKVFYSNKEIDDDRR